eukprot:m.75971 g.75971  ORF g.75971 m.75971 type:complete len:279 (+) comp12534_c0_seq1:1217-2053(+)
MEATPRDIIQKVKLPRQKMQSESYEEEEEPSAYGLEMEGDLAASIDALAASIGYTPLTPGETPLPPTPKTTTPRPRTRKVTRINSSGVIQDYEVLSETQTEIEPRAEIFPQMYFPNESQHISGSDVSQDHPVDIRMDTINTHNCKAVNTASSSLKSIGVNTHTFKQNTQGKSLQSTAVNTDVPQTKSIAVNTDPLPNPSYKSVAVNTDIPLSSVEINTDIPLSDTYIDVTEPKIPQFTPPIKQQQNETLDWLQDSLPLDDETCNRMAEEIVKKYINCF